ncbi:hypothetical protein, partial [Pseudonocardia sp.]|uniref:hypothetical protein n=1 Tax=Pseudonocardia sp. TaxID=60912 RepID=UPI0031FC8E8D
TAVGSVVAPTTLLTALLFYFGWLHAQAMLRYFRVQLTVFDFTLQDYLVRSADGLFLPVTIAAAVALVFLWVNRFLLGGATTLWRAKVLRILAPVTGVAGIALMALALAAALGNHQVFGTFPEGGGLSLSVGVLLLAYTARLARRVVADRPPGRASSTPTPGVLAAEWGAVFILVSVGLFWAVNSYALGVGTGRAQQIERELASAPDVVLYSEKSLDLQVIGVRELVCSDPAALTEAAFRYRYEGLKFVLRSGNQLLFLPAGWTRDAGNALVIPRTDGMRLEFTGPRRGVASRC